MINGELARVFGLVADLLEIDGANAFRVSSYRRVARTIKNTTDDLADLAAKGRMGELTGVGKGSADRIKTFIDTGSFDALEELQAKLPKGLPELLSISGMGPKKIRLVYTELGVKGMADLKRVIETGAMAKLPGLGVASVKKIAEGIAFLERSAGRTPLGVALPIAEAFALRVGQLEGVTRVDVAGSLRRGAETVGDIDLLCEAADAASVVKQFVAFDEVTRVLASGATKGSVTVAIAQDREIQIDLRVVASESFGSAMQYFTGSKEHNVRLREIALKKNFRLNEYGLYDGERQIAGHDEPEVYTKLGRRCPAPEIREDCGELDVEASGDALVTLADIRGDLHMHTTASDGKNSIVEMAEAAKALGYEYIAICDHSKSSTIANGLSIERMKRHIDDIRKADARVEGISILVGSECDILPDGSLDYPDELLAACDWVVASIHSAMGKSGSGKRNATQRTLAAMANPYVSVIGHPTGRLINRRGPMELDMAVVVEEAARTATLLEINASWQRLDLKDIHVRLARGGGVGLVINTDAHHTQQLAQMRFGVITARRGGASAGDVVNTLSLEKLRKRIDQKRR